MIRIVRAQAMFGPNGSLFIVYLIFSSYNYKLNKS